jgi:hypothetical protein
LVASADTTFIAFGHLRLYFSLSLCYLGMALCRLLRHQTHLQARRCHRLS